MPLFWLPENSIDFPPAEMARKDGLLAVGGDLNPERVLHAYQQGIFPWFGEGDPYLWWSPDPRFVLFPNELKVAKSMRPYFNQRKFSVSFDRDFLGVMRACQEIRLDETGGGTWITEEMVESYYELHKQGYAHSVEVWQSGCLAGGLYGVSIGRVFFGESMFSKVSNASKAGFITLVRALEKLGFDLIDCQQETAHLASLGARGIPRKAFLEILDKNQAEETIKGSWDRLFYEGENE